MKRTASGGASVRTERIMSWLTKRLAHAFKSYLHSAGGSIPMSGEAIEGFFASHPEQRTVVQSQPGILGAMLASGDGLTVVVGLHGRTITLSC
jgi:hypothetical protein